MKNNGIIVLLGYFLICLSFCFEFSGSCSSISTIYMTIIALLHIWEKSIKILFLLLTLGGSLVLEFQALSSSLLLLLEVLDPRNQQPQTQHLTFGAFVESPWPPSMASIPISTHLRCCTPLLPLHIQLNSLGLILKVPANGSWVCSILRGPLLHFNNHHTKLPWWLSMAATFRTELPPSTTTIPFLVILSTQPTTSNHVRSTYSLPCSTQASTKDPWLTSRLSSLVSTRACTPWI